MASTFLRAGRSSSYWYEWTGTKAPKQPYLFTRKDGHSFAFAGIWTTRFVDDQKISTYAILTTDADKLSAPIHDRMPLVVNPLLYDAWLWPDSEPQDYGAVIENPHADGGFEVFPVSKGGNSPKNNSPELAIHMGAVVACSIFSMPQLVC